MMSQSGMTGHADGVMMGAWVQRKACWSSHCWETVVPCDPSHYYLILLWSCQRSTPSASTPPFSGLRLRLVDKRGTG